MCAQFYSRAHDAVIRVYDAAGNVIETQEHAGDFKNRSSHMRVRANITGAEQRAILEFLKSSP